MGIFIGLALDPTGIRKDAWQKAYDESLQLLNAWEFCDVVVDSESFPGMVGFSDTLTRYFNLGFDLDRLCEICVLDEDGCRIPAAEFIDHFIRMGFHEPNEIPDQIFSNADSSRPETVDSLLTGFFMRTSGIRPGLKSPIPLDQIREVFARRLGNECDTASRIAESLKDEPVDDEEELDENDPLDQLIAEIKKAGKSGRPAESREQAGDISRFADLISWQPGQTFSRNIQKGLDLLVESVERIKDEQRDEISMMYRSRDRREWLIKLNRYFVIRDSNWKHIFERSQDESFFGTVCALLFIDASEMTTSRLCKAAANNLPLFTLLFSEKGRSGAGGSESENDNDNDNDYDNDKRDKKSD